MKPTPDILLINSYAPRQRVVSDAALENSLVILRTYLESKGIQAEIIDDQRVTTLENGVPQWCLQLLKVMTRLLMKTYRLKPVAAGLLLAAWPLQAYALQCRREYLRNRLRDIAVDLKNRHIPIVGLKLWYGEAYTWCRELATEIRRHSPETVIIAGGPQVKVYGDFVLSHSEFDLAIMGPGEEILEKIITLYRQTQSKSVFLEQVHEQLGGRLLKTGGFAGNQNDVIRGLAAQTIPNYHNADLDDKILFHTIVDGVGCSWNNCNFCSHTRCAVPFTPRPVEDIITEIKAMLQRGISFFRFSSSETPMAHGRKIAEAILTHGLNIRFSMFVRAANVSEETLATYRLLIQAGLRAVFMGGETGHDGVNREIMNKGVERKDIINTIATIRLASDAVSLPCRVGLSLIYPCPLPPGIAMEEVFQANITLIDAALPDTVIVNPPGPFPETNWYKEADKFGFRFSDGAATFTQRFMEYEYSIYKPVEFWDDLGSSLNDMESKTVLKETGKLRAYAASLGIPTDISDEYLMMTEAIGLQSKLDLVRFKQKTLLDIISGSTDYTREITASINAASRQLARTYTE
ncbi:B12-binding domain-containing radical SAM protein [Sporomusa sp.]|uniref:B12-binding domain-containing radical SAM protein n=1 Tax=Sporomusa sp. TaxID=2078658 RepID=UPI002CB9C0F4|nr:cobalamin-dependent protein [Sporomusa sp.]HWR06937.1 cobalamin-dependent protein [Sporomusa sp.]HWR42323.1 cobalamin-dependent protein [Sporomusa sp.]